MLTYPDFEEKQLIYIQSEEVKNLSIKNSNLLSEEEGKTINQAPLAKIFAIMIVGNCTMTSTMIKKLIEHGVIILLMDRNLAPYCLIGGETEGNTLLRQKQYDSTNDFKRACWIVENKIENQILLLKKKRKKSSIPQLQKLIASVAEVEDEKRLLGLEGNASKVFFQNFFADQKWHGRKPRTKFDEINTLMDIGYTYLFHFIEANLRLYGFDLYKGFYHTTFFQRKSLVCDIMEPFRCIIDNAISRIFALKTFDPKDFKIYKGQYQIKLETGSKYTKIFLAAIMENKEEIFRYIQTFYRIRIKEGDDYPKFQCS